jgi:uncharacterized membrane-anchored protein
MSGEAAMMTRIKLFKSTAFKYAAVAALPLIALMYGQIRNFTILMLGESVLLETRPVDPRDILRGDYVVLDYKISDIPEALFPEDMREFRRKIVYVTLDRAASGIGTVKGVSAAPPSDGFYIKGKMDYGRIDYGIGAYYVPEGTGRDIERKINASKVLVDVRIFKGNPVIKSLRFIDFTDEERRKNDRQLNGTPEAEEE